MIGGRVVTRKVNEAVVSVRLIGAQRSTSGVVNWWRGRSMP